MDATLSKELVTALLQDKKRDRRWKIIKFFIFIALIVTYISLAVWHIGGVGKDSPSAFDRSKGYVALIRLNGEIMPDAPFSSKKVIPELNQAFRDKAAKAVVLLVNSPGGSPVQSSIIHDKIVALKKKFKKPVSVVAEDTLASGAYLVSSAADNIFVNPDTLTGSIGVIMSGFGLTDAIKKIGVTRRVYTAGSNKSRLDPFEPVSPASKEKIDTVLAEVHQQFIKDVVDGRGKRLQGDPKELFSGDFWTGSMAVKLGLADGTANLWDVLKKQYGVTQYVDYSGKPPLLRSLLENMRSQLGLGALMHQHLSAELS